MRHGYAILCHDLCVVCAMVRSIAIYIKYCTYMNYVYVRNFRCYSIALASVGELISKVFCGLDMVDSDCSCCNSFGHLSESFCWLLKGAISYRIATVTSATWYVVVGAPHATLRYRLTGNNGRSVAYQGRSDLLSIMD